VTPQLFPVIRFAEGFLASWNDDHMPRARAEALKRCLGERALLAGEPPPLPSRIQRSQYRKVAPTHEPSTVLHDLNTWESTPLGSPYSTIVVTVGEAARKALSPAFEASNLLRVIDPYLTVDPREPDPTRSHKGSTVALIEAARDVSRIDVSTRIDGKKDEDRLRAIEKMAEWLAQYVADNPTKLTEVTWSFFTFSAGVHDRFFGFNNKIRGSEHEWMAVSLGRGASSLADELTLNRDGHSRVCLARISPAHFLEVWNEVQQHVRWRIQLDRDTPGDIPDWRELEAPRKCAEWSLRVLRRRDAPGS